jgi:hypothetical protein
MRWWVGVGMSSDEDKERREIEAEVERRQIEDEIEQRKAEEPRAVEADPARVMTSFYNSVDQSSVESDYIFDKFPRNERLIPQEFEGLSRAQAIDKMVPELSKLDLKDTRSKTLANPIFTQFPELPARIKIYQESLASSQPDPKQVLQQKIEQIETAFKRRGLAGPAYLKGLKELKQDKETLADGDSVQIKGLEEKYKGDPQDHVNRLSKDAKKVEVVDAPGAVANKENVRQQIMNSANKQNVKQPIMSNDNKQNVKQSIVSNDNQRSVNLRVMGNAIVNFFKKIPENIAGLFRQKAAAPAPPPESDRNAPLSRSESLSFEDSESIESPRNSGEKPASTDFENQKGGAYDFGPEKPSAKFSSEQPSSRAVNQQARDSFASIAKAHTEISAEKGASVDRLQAEEVLPPPTLK